MENDNDFGYKNSLNIFSITFGPFEKKAKEIDEDELAE
jgi:hypothetical protein